MPRWNNGWGVQILHEYRNRDALLLKDRIEHNLDEQIHILHAQGVYTWTKAFRVTAKLPIVFGATREFPDDIQGDSGFGPLTLALPLKSYFNLDGRSGSFTLSPQLRVPTASPDAFDVIIQEWGNGLSVGYTTETYRYHFSLGASTWVYYGDKPSSVTLSTDFGFNIQALGSSGHIKWMVALLHETDDTYTLSGGPILYWRISDLLHAQILWRRDYYDRQGTLDHGNDNSFRYGFGVVY